jgi:hypothetical protein
MKKQRFDTCETRLYIDDTDKIRFQPRKKRGPKGANAPVEING